jgi:hypothetical protein
MKKLMILAAMVLTGTLLMTGCSTCCKKDDSCTKPAASLSCTNHVTFDLAECAKGCTNKLTLDLAECPKGCTNKFSTFSLNACTNQFNLLLTECPKGCTNKFSLLSTGCTNNLVLDGCTSSRLTSCSVRKTAARINSASSTADSESVFNLKPQWIFRCGFFIRLTVVQLDGRKQV